MSAQWLSSSSDWPGRAGSVLNGILQSLARPQNARRVRQVLLLLAALWAIFALARLVWILLPGEDDTLGAAPPVINPATATASGAAAKKVDIDRMVAWHLFGKADATEVAVVEAPEPQSDREGIEKGARETRLNLTLRGIVASTDDGLGHAIIEHKSQQAVYAVEDKLPVSGRVFLAKVMPRQVVIDNGGTYELLVLFDDSPLGSKSAATPPRPRPKVAPAAASKQRTDGSTASLAANYRERLYQNPQSLIKVVRVSAVRAGSKLRGYRVQPGEDKEQFEQLGFQSGDLVLSVNGVDLTSPANTMRLYNLMRSAKEAVFEIERAGQPVTLSVSLAAVASP